jgi:hypothetical protein
LRQGVPHRGSWTGSSAGPTDLVPEILGVNGTFGHTDTAEGVCKTLGWAGEVACLGGVDSIVTAGTGAETHSGQLISEGAISAFLGAYPGVVVCEEELDIRAPIDAVVDERVSPHHRF